MSDPKRNAPCPCGSGKKYKHCCGRARRPGGGFARKDNKTAFCLILILCLSVGLRVYGYRQPHGLTFDEGLYAELLGPQLLEDPTDYGTQEAYQAMVSQGQPLPAYLNAPLFKHPPVFCYLIAVAYALFGAGHGAAVGVAMAFGALMVLAVFFLGQALYDKRVGLLAAFLLAIDPVHWVCSEKIWMGTTRSFFVLASVLLFTLAIKKRAYFVPAGISVGLALLTKYTGVLVLAATVSFALLFERRLFKERFFYFFLGLPVLMFLPWVVWNWEVYHHLLQPLFWRHTSKDWRRHFGAKATVGAAWIFLVGAGSFLGRLMPERFRRGIMWTAGAVVLGLLLFWTPARAALLDILSWRHGIATGWSNPFHDEKWFFYLYRLPELSAVYFLSFASFFCLSWANRRDGFLWWVSLWILGFSILWGNYQSRYVLAAVPFLLILAARFYFWMYDQIAGEGSLRALVHAEAGGSSLKATLLKVIWLTVGIYCVAKTLKVDSLIAFKPDFGYF